MYQPCRECGVVGRVRLVSRSELASLGTLAGHVLIPWPEYSGAVYWWCDGCQAGGAFMRSSVLGSWRQGGT